MAKKSKAQTWMEYLAIRCLLVVIEVLPRSISLAIAKALASAVFRFLDGRQTAGMKNLEIAFPEIDPSERKRILRASIQNLGRTFVEFALFQPANAVEAKETIVFRFEAEAFQTYRRARDAGRGVLLTTAHIGNWEVLLSAFALQYEPIYFVAREMDNRSIEKLFAQKRAKFGSRQFHKSDSAKHIMKALKTGESVGILPDVNVLPNEGVFVPFFGVPACTTSGVARLAIHSNALIIPAFAVWDDSESRYVVYNGKPIEPSNSGDKERDVLETTAAYTLEIEKIIRRFPEQWLWIHKRWKTRPPGEPGIY